MKQLAAWRKRKTVSTVSMIEHDGVESFCMTVHWDLMYDQWFRHALSRGLE